MINAYILELSNTASSKPEPFAWLKEPEFPQIFRKDLAFGWGEVVAESIVFFCGLTNEEGCQRQYHLPQFSINRASTIIPKDPNSPETAIGAELKIKLNKLISQKPEVSDLLKVRQMCANIFAHFGIGKSPLLWVSVTTGGTPEGNKALFALDSDPFAFPITTKVSIINTAPETPCPGSLNVCLGGCDSGKTAWVEDKLNPKFPLDRVTFYSQNERDRYCLNIEKIDGDLQAVMQAAVFSELLEQANTLATTFCNQLPGEVSKIEMSLKGNKKNKKRNDFSFGISHKLPQKQRLMIKCFSQLALVMAFAPSGPTSPKPPNRRFCLDEPFEGLDLRYSHALMMVLGHALQNNVDIYLTTTSEQAMQKMEAFAAVLGAKIKSEHLMPWCNSAP